MAKYVVNSRLHFARNIILAESKQFRSSPLLVAAKRCTSVATTIKIAVNKPNRKLETQKSNTEIAPKNRFWKVETWKVLRENLLQKIAAFKNIITSEARIFFENNEVFSQKLKVKKFYEKCCRKFCGKILRESIAGKYCGKVLRKIN